MANKAMTSISTHIITPRLFLRVFGGWSNENTFLHLVADMFTHIRYV